jgi:hypothetical protein
MSVRTNTGTLKGLQIIHRAMLIGQVMFLAIAIFLKLTDSFPSDLHELDKTLQVVAIVLCLGGFFIGSSLFKKKIQHAVDTYPPDIKEKAVAYRSACIVQWALLEGPSLFCIICFLLVGNYAFAALAISLMLLFGLTAPVKLKVMLQLRLSEEEMEQF